MRRTSFPTVLKSSALFTWAKPQKIHKVITELHALSLPAQAVNAAAYSSPQGQSTAVMPLVPLYDFSSEAQVTELSKQQNKISKSSYPFPSLSYHSHQSLDSSAAVHFVASFPRPREACHLSHEPFFQIRYFDFIF